MDGACAAWILMRRMTAGRLNGYRLGRFSSFAGVCATLACNVRSVRMQRAHRRDRQHIAGEYKVDRQGFDYATAHAGLAARKAKRNDNNVSIVPRNGNDKLCCRSVRLRPPF